MIMKTEIEGYELSELQLSDLEILKIPAPEIPKEFSDPFKADPNAEIEEDPKAKKQEKGKKEEPEEEVEDDGPRYHLGPFKKDGKGGDASPLLRPPPVNCQAFFSRQLYVSKEGSKSLKKHLITTNVICVYFGTPKAQIYNFQKAQKSTINEDLSADTLQKAFIKKKLAEKRKGKNGWAELMKTAREEAEK